jgi:hypothetical protein
MRFVGIVVFDLVSGSYYDGGGTSEINALKTSKSNDIQFVRQGECHSIGLKFHSLSLQCL